jgi:hypothetical protein
MEDFAKGSMTSLLVGLGVALAAPVLFPALASGIRPLAKGIIKGGVVVFDAAKEAFAEAEEQLSDLMAEARHEMEQTHKTATTAAAAATGRK